MNRLTRAIAALMGKQWDADLAAAPAVRDEINQWLSSLSAHESPEIPDATNPTALAKMLTGIAARAVIVKAQAVASRPLYLYDRTGEMITDHPVMERLKYPNWNMTLSDFLTYTVMWLETNGNAYWLYVSDGDEKNRGFWPLVPWNVRIVRKSNPAGMWDVIDSYEFYGWGSPKRFAPDKVWHVKYPNPSDPYLYGRPTLADCAPGLVVLDLMYRHNIYGLSAGGFPAVAAILAAQGDPQEIGALKKRMREEMRYAFAGYRASRSIAIFPPGTEIKSIGTTEREMEFYEGHQIMVEQVLAILGVPASKLGLVKDVNRANAEANDLTFQGEVVQPLCELLAQALTSDWLWIVDPEASEQGLHFRFAPVDLSDREFELRKAEVYLRTGVLLPNEVRANEGMGDRPDGGGDRPVFVEEAEARLGLAADASSMQEEAVGPVIVKAHPSRADMLVSHRIVWGRTVNLQLAKWRKHIRAAFNGAESRAREYADNYRVADMALIMDFLFPKRDEMIADMARSGAEIVLASRNAGRRMAARWLAGGGKSVNMEHMAHMERMALAAAWTERRQWEEWEETDIVWATSEGERLAAILWGSIHRDIMRLGITDEGELGDLVAAVVRTNERVLGVNSLSLARTEATRDINSGLYDGYIDAGATHKQWNAVGDEDTRLDHLEADGQVVPIDENFVVGGEEAPYPGYEGLSEEQSINCRCVALPYERTTGER